MALVLTVGPLGGQRSSPSRTVRLLDRVDAAALAPVRLVHLGVGRAALHGQRSVQEPARRDPEVQPGRLWDEAGVARYPRAIAATVPIAQVSSSGTVSKTTSPASRTPQAWSASSAKSAAPMPPSCRRRHGRRSGRRGRRPRRAARPSGSVAGVDDVDVAVDDEAAAVPAPRIVPTVSGRPRQWCHGGIIGWSANCPGSGSHWSTSAPIARRRSPT